MKYFVDTCVWRDFFEERKGFGNRDLSSEALIFFKKVMVHKDVILFSDFLIRELKLKYSILEIEYRLKLFSLLGLLNKVEILKEEFYEAKLLSKQRNLPLADCLNAIQARNHKAVLISQDKHILVNLKDVTISKRPSEII